MKIIKFALRVLGYLVVSLIVGYCLFMMNAKFVLHEQLPMLAGYGNAVVLSGSMSPTIEVNDLLIIQKCESYSPDDIITFVDEQNCLVTHRLIALDGETAYTQGDANNVGDPPFNVSRIKGKVVMIMPGVGNVVEIVQNPFVAAIAIGAAMLMMHISYSKETEKKDEKLDAIRAQIEELKAQQSAEAGEKTDDSSVEEKNDNKPEEVSDENTG